MNDPNENMASREPLKTMEHEAAIQAPVEAGKGSGSALVNSAIAPAEPSKAGVHADPQKALEEVGTYFKGWTTKLTDTSLQMCYALIGANWVVFGSVGGILKSECAKLSLLAVLLTLAFNVAGAWYMSESLRLRFEWAESHSEEWQKAFKDSAGKRDAFPFTDRQEFIAKALRQIKGGLPLISGVLLVWGAIAK